MFTLKIKWYRYEKVDPLIDPNSNSNSQYEAVDETTLFISADQVMVHGEINSLDEMSAWGEGSFFNYRIEPAEAQSKAGPSRLIQIDKNGKSTWYLASLAWLMGPTGQTIEKLHS